MSLASAFSPAISGLLQNPQFQSQIAAFKSGQGALPTTNYNGSNVSPLLGGMGSQVYLNQSPGINVGSASKTYTPSYLASGLLPQGQSKMDLYNQFGTAGNHLMPQQQATPQMAAPIQSPLLGGQDALNMFGPSVTLQDNLNQTNSYLYRLLQNAGQ